MLKHAHPEFPSDIFLLLEAVGAELIVLDTHMAMAKYKPSEWLAQSMDKKLLFFVSLPELTPQHKFMYDIPTELALTMPR